MDIYSSAVLQIIKQQQAIVGPLAIELAKNTKGLEYKNESEIKLSQDGRAVLSALVEQYQKLFGRASIEVCRDAVKELHPSIPQSDLPEILR